MFRILKAISDSEQTILERFVIIISLGFAPQWTTGTLLFSGGCMAWAGSASSVSLHFLWGILWPNLVRKKARRGNIIFVSYLFTRPSPEQFLHERRILHIWLREEAKHSDEAVLHPMTLANPVQAFVTLQIDFVAQICFPISQYIWCQFLIKNQLKHSRLMLLSLFIICSYPEKAQRSRLEL